MKGWGRVNHDKDYHKIINRNLLFCNSMKKYKLKKNKDKDVRYPVFLEYIEIPAIWGISLWVVGQGCCRGSKTIQTLVPPLNCPPELVDETLFLKTPHIFTARCREIKLELNQKFSPCWLAFIVFKTTIALLTPCRLHAMESARSQKGNGSLKWLWNLRIAVATFLGKLHPRDAIVAQPL